MCGGHLAAAAVAVGNALAAAAFVDVDVDVNASSARDDEDGVLVLSQFAGAARELPEAIVVNPYDVDQVADAIRLALGTPEDERRLRMRSMRAYVQEFNVYRWAGRMLIDAARMRQKDRVFERMTTEI